jgi:hypothetical protein
MLRLTPRIEPIIDVWDTHHATALEEEERRQESPWRSRSSERQLGFEP